MHVHSAMSIRPMPAAHEQPAWIDGLSQAMVQARIYLPDLKAAAQSACRPSWPCCLCRSCLIIEARELSKIRVICYKGSAMPETEPGASGGPVTSERDASPGRRQDSARGRKTSLPPDFDDNLSELIDTAEHLAGNPVAAWSAIKAEVERRIAHRQEWTPSGTDEPTHEGVGRGRLGQNTGGAMPTHPGAVMLDRRQFLGFDLEVATYERLKPELLSRCPGKFVVIVGNEVEGPVDTFPEALRAGYRRFGLGPLFVKEILPVEPVAEVTRDIMPCRS
jgi:hypothetical protein